MAKTILIVDDGDDIRILLRTVLQRHGYRTGEAANAWQALAALQQEPIDLVILDLRMPFNVSGADLIQTLQDLGRTTPVIVLSGWTGDLDRSSLPPFVHAVLDKPVQIDTLMARVEQALGRDGDAD